MERWSVVILAACHILTSGLLPQIGAWDQIKRETTECHENVIVQGLGGRVTSPGYPHKYASSANCKWELTSPSGGNIILDLVLMDIENSPGCQYDYAEIYVDGSRLLERLCGRVEKRTIFTNSSHVTIVFVSDASYQEQGFVIDYKSDVLDECQEVLRGTTGNVTSPGFPGNYPDNRHCVTKLVGPPDRQCYLRFNVLALEYEDRCSYDYVEIFDGSLTNGSSLGRHCSAAASLHKTIVTQHEIVYVVFHSDSLLNNRGFHLSYSFTDPPSAPAAAAVLPHDSAGTHLSRTPGGCLWYQGNGRNGSFTSPNYPEKYPSKSLCEMVVRAPSPRARILLDLTSLYLEEDDNCTSDFLEIRDGDSEDAPLMGRFCGRSTEKLKLNSTGPALWVKFQSDYFAEFSGFKANYLFLLEDDIKGPVSEKKRLEFTKVSSNVTVDNLESTTLECLTNSPWAKIKWMKEGTVLDEDNTPPGLKVLDTGQVLVESMAPQLAGTYTCVAVAPEGNISHSLFLSLPPQTNCTTVLRRTPRDRTLEEGEFTSLECFSPGFSASWDKNGKSVQLGPRHQQLQNGYLVISDVRAEDTGVYTCTTVNKVQDCVWRVSARVTVLRRRNSSEVCGRPVLGWPSQDKPQVDHGKIIGGKSTKLGAYPWQVMLWDPVLKAFCGGSLLNERWVATAAHCFFKPEINYRKVLVKLGKHDQIAESEPGEVVTRIEQVVYHPNYERRIHDNDLALLRLTDHIRFSDTILPVCLGDENDHPVLEGEGPVMGTVTGWGHLTDDGVSLPRYLQALRMPIIDQDTCVKSTTYVVTKNMFCAGYGQEIAGDACHGDSGGPFVMERQKRWYLVGVVSWGEGCGRKGKYGFYTRLSNYLTWINAIIKF